MADLTIPSHAQPVVDPKTGRIHPDWYQYLKRLTELVNAGL